jgi:beta-N-acetylhexosaminidase
VAGTLLRTELGFKGLAISDDLTAGSAATGMPAPQAAVQALTAGTDVALISNAKQATAARQAILKAARAGSIPAARLDQALARILLVKQKLGLPGIK